MNHNLTRKERRLTKHGRLSRQRSAGVMVQALESRLMFSTVLVWSDGSGVDHDWQTPGNWETEVGGLTNDVPINGGGNFYVAKFTKSANVSISSDFTVDEVKIVGNTTNDVDVNFQMLGNSGRLFQVRHGNTGDFHNIELATANGKLTALRIWGDHSDPTLYTVKADNFLLTGNATASTSALTVKWNGTLELQSNIDTGRHQFDLTNDGIIKGASAIIRGAPIPAAGNAAISNINMTGSLTLHVANKEDGMLRVGSTGQVVFNATGSNFSIDNLYIGSYSEMNLYESNASVNHLSWIGSVPTGVTWAESTLLGKPGAKLRLFNHSNFIAKGNRPVGDPSNPGRVGDAFVISSGNGALLNVEGASYFEVNRFAIGWSEQNMPLNARALFSGEDTKAVIRENMGIAGDHIAGTSSFLGAVVRISDRADIEVRGKLHISGWPTYTPRNPQLELSSRATFRTNEAVIDAGSFLRLSGPATKMTVSGASPFRIGNGKGPVDFQVLTGASVESHGQVIKEQKAVVIGGAAIDPLVGVILVTPTGPVAAAGVGGDFAPGDFFALDNSGQVVAGTSLLVYDEEDILISSPYYEYDEDGNVILDGAGNAELSDAPSNPFGIMSIGQNNSIGSLDTTLRMTLDTALGTHGQSALLLVTGTATLGGAIPGQFRAIATDPGYVANYTTGTAFTILTAGTISGSFSIPSYNTSDPNSPNFSSTYAWGSPLPLSMQNDTTSFPTLASGLDWAIDKRTGTDSTQSLILTVVQERPTILDVATASAPSTIKQNFDIAFKANPNATTSYMPFVIQAQGKVNLHNGSGLNLPAANATVGNWNTLPIASLNSTAPGFYTATVQMQVGSVYNFRVLAETIYGSSNAHITDAEDVEPEAANYRFPFQQHEWRRAA